MNNQEVTLVDTKNRPKVSIVIPIYNTGEYLRECLDSVVNQTLKDIEIILVDDGSTDNSIDICKEYEGKDPRVRLIVQENSGAAAARRTGAKIATAPYIGFVDSDDFIDRDMYETLASYMEDCDLVTSSAVNSRGGIWRDYLPPKYYSSANEMKYVLDNMMIFGYSDSPGISVAMHCKLYKTNLANLVFDSVNLSIYSGEDADFIYRYVLQCRSVCITDICKYHYRVRMGSLVHSIHHDYMMNLNLIYLSLRDAFIGHKYEDNLIEALQILIAHNLYKIPVGMGFTTNARVLKYINPYSNEFRNKRIALYGAGDVGKDYYLHMLRMGSEPVIWVDKQYEKYQEQYPVQPVCKLASYEYDILMIALKNSKVAEEIKRDLIAFGIESDKIFWREPINILGRS